MQLLCLTAMEPPISLSADAVRDEKVKVLRSLRRHGAKRGARATSSAGSTRAASSAAKRRPGLPRGAGRVARRRRVETYVAMKVPRRQLALERRALLRARRQAPRAPRDRDRRRLPRGAAHALPGAGRRDHRRTCSRCASSPTRGSRCASSRRSPGSRPSCATSRWTSATAPTFGSNTPEAYERLLLDAMRGEATLFTRRDEVEEQWAYIDPVLRAGPRDGQPAAADLRRRLVGPRAGRRRARARRTALEDAVSALAESPRAVLARVDDRAARSVVRRAGRRRAPKTRACTMNLVVVAPSPQAARPTGCPVVDEVLQAVPARAIVVGLDRGRRRRPRGRRHGRLHARQRRRTLVCSERVTLVARGGAVCARVASCVDASAPTDVPTTLVWLGRVHVERSGVRAARARRARASSSTLSHGSLASLANVVCGGRARPRRGRAPRRRGARVDAPRALAGALRAHLRRAAAAPPRRTRSRACARAGAPGGRDRSAPRARSCSGGWRRASDGRRRRSPASCACSGATRRARPGAAPAEHAAQPRRAGPCSRSRIEAGGGAVASDGEIARGGDAGAARGGSRST